MPPLFHSVAQCVGAGASAVPTHFDVTGLDSNGNRKRAVLRLLVMTAQRRLDIVRVELAIASD